MRVQFDVLKSLCAVNCSYTTCSASQLLWDVVAQSLNLVRNLITGIPLDTDLDGKYFEG